MVKRPLPLICLILTICISAIHAQDLPANELQINLSGYFDSFDVNVIYPSISLTTRLSESTTFNARYLVDMITAASIKGNSDNSISTGTGAQINVSDKNPINTTSSIGGVDAVTAASSGGGNGENISLVPSFDDVRNEYNLGATQLFAGNLISLNGIYSTERDYSSKTVAATISRQFALKNTTLELGFVHSWDRIYPKTKNWTRKKSVVTYSANFSQVLSKNALVQFLSSYSEYNGYLADAYSLVGIDSFNSKIYYDPIHPDNRIRRSVAAKVKFRLNTISSLLLGYRYYWDNWDIVSHTISSNYMRHLKKNIILSLGWRFYTQSRAGFFQTQYQRPMPLMTTDIKLDKSFSNTLQLGLIINGGRGQNYLPFLRSKKVQYNFDLNIYQRHTQSEYWFNGLKDLIAMDFNIGLRYRF